MGAAHAQQGKFVKVSECLYRYSSNGIYYAVARHSGKLIRRSLETDDRALAKRKLADFKRDLEKIDPAAGGMSLDASCDRYLEICAHQAPKTLRRKRDIVTCIKRDWPGGSQILVRKIKPSAVSQWLASYDFGWASQQLYLACIRAIFDLAVDDGVMAHNPARAPTIKRKRKETPIRLTPTWDEFNQIIADVRGQPFNSDATETADFLEYLGVAGQGQAEAGSLRWRDIDWANGFVKSFRAKTRTGFEFPLYARLRELLKRRKAERESQPEDLVFTIKDAKRALAASCKRLGLSTYSQRSFRRLFVSHAINRGVDPKTLAKWQGHQDGGKLIFSTYSHLFEEHSKEMAARI